MPGSPLIEAEHKIILRNADLVDIREIRSYMQWQHTLKLNEVSSWQLDMHTSDFENVDQRTEAASQARRASAHAIQP